MYLMKKKQSLPKQVCHGVVEHNIKLVYDFEKIFKNIVEG